MRPVFLALALGTLLIASELVLAGTPPTPAPEGRFLSPLPTPTATDRRFLSPVATPTPTPTTSLTPTLTPTPTPTFVPGAFRLGVFDPSSSVEPVGIENTAAVPLNLSGWQLRATRSGQRFTVPAGTVLGPGERIVVVSGPSVTAAEPSRFLWSPTHIFDDHEDGVQLLNLSGQVVDARAFVAPAAAQNAGTSLGVPPARAPGDPIDVYVSGQPWSPVDPRRSIDGAHVVAVGQVVAVEPARFNTPDGRRPPDLGAYFDWARPQHRIVTPYVVRVTEGLRGAQPGDRLVVWQAGGRVGADSVTFSHPGGLNRIGQRVLLFARPYDQAVVAGIWTAIAAEVDEQDRVHTYRQVTPLDAVRAAVAAAGAPPHAP